MNKQSNMGISHERNDHVDSNPPSRIQSRFQTEADSHHQNKRIKIEPTSDNDEQRQVRQLSRHSKHYLQHTQPHAYIDLDS